ncbi:MAG TPA: AEC family transporter, partial [Sutterella wadsworthensis]|nr:AEC family transporter [Sutterella wadsworthensis]
LPPAAAGVVILFAALPTAQSCYVMTAAMHGNAPAVAAATSLQTLAAI